MTAKPQARSETAPRYAMLTRAEIQRLRGLRLKKQREAQGLFVIEGEKVVAELLAARFPFEGIYATAAWTGEKTHEISPAVMARISHFPTPSGVLAVGSIERRALGPGELNHGLTLALDGVQDPGNVGTILRIADWYAIDRVVLAPDCADLFSQKVINASRGSFARVKTHVAGLATVFQGLDVPVLGCDMRGESVHEMAPVRDAVIVIGGEGRGPSPAVRDAVTRFVAIPKYGGGESLNAAVAAAVVCDNLRRAESTIKSS